MELFENYAAHVAAFQFIKFSPVSYEDSLPRQRVSVNNPKFGKPCVTRYRLEGQRMLMSFTKDGIVRFSNELGDMVFRHKRGCKVGPFFSCYPYANVPFEVIVHLGTVIITDIRGVQFHDYKFEVLPVVLMNLNKKNEDVCLVDTITKQPFNFTLVKPLFRSSFTEQVPKIATHVNVSGYIVSSVSYEDEYSNEDLLIKN